MGRRGRGLTQNGWHLSGYDLEENKDCNLGRVECGEVVDGKRGVSV